MLSHLYVEYKSIFRKSQPKDVTVITGESSNTGPKYLLSLEPHSVIEGNLFENLLKTSPDMTEEKSKILLPFLAHVSKDNQNMLTLKLVGHLAGSEARTNYLIEMKTEEFQANVHICVEESKVLVIDTVRQDHSSTPENLGSGSELFRVTEKQLISLFDESFVSRWAGKLLEFYHIVYSADQKGDDRFSIDDLDEYTCLNEFSTDKRQIEATLNRKVYLKQMSHKELVYVYNKKQSIESDSPKSEIQLYTVDHTSFLPKFLHNRKFERQENAPSIFQESFLRQSKPLKLSPSIVNDVLSMTSFFEAILSGY